jgi:hypothetical protein
MWEFSLCEQDEIIWLRGGILDNEVPIPRQESEWSCMCVLGRPLYICSYCFSSRFFNCCECVVSCGFFYSVQCKTFLELCYVWYTVYTFNIVVLKNQVVSHLLRNLDRLMYCRLHWEICFPYPIVNHHCGKIRLRNSLNNALNLFYDGGVNLGINVKMSSLPESDKVISLVPMKMKLL